ncbi:MAG TPA: radical SAM protein [Clostridiales bacterium]|nr:radical SAM protein [Clostridiales bacterium]
MRYEGVIYRPPSEARSLIVQVTIGCSHNRCIFCSSYQGKIFRIRKMDEIFEDFEMARRFYGKVRRIFLADGNALVLKTDDLKKILEKIKELFPECERVATYGAPKDILGKTVEELKLLRELGLKIIYLGVESGSDEILEFIQKGVTSAQMVEAGKRVVQSGIDLSVTLISGLGGKEKWREHARESARVMNEINPQYIGLLTLMVEPGTVLYEKVRRNEFQLLTPKEVMMETREFLQHIEVKDCVFRSNHASNYVALGGTLPQDKERLLALLDELIRSDYQGKPEFLRML